MNARERLDQIQARTDAATEGPWFREYCDVIQDQPDPRDVHEEDPRDARVVRRAEHRHLRDQQGIADAEFIAATRQDIPALVTALRAILNLAQEHVPSDEHICPEDILEIARERLGDA